MPWTEVQQQNTRLGNVKCCLVHKHRQSVAGCNILLKDAFVGCQYYFHEREYMKNPHGWQDSRFPSRSFPKPLTLSPGAPQVSDVHAPDHPPDGKKTLIIRPCHL
ncbi:hypothetical protein ILYODFUR_016547 [Ilyodon furcidens]|uniref:Uncharacterized protein n=1 Tax=Ilyodon furcidens TaxID=33524 RepID=A0ABV0USV3_9TELE